MVCHPTGGMAIEVFERRSKIGYESQRDVCSKKQIILDYKMASSRRPQHLADDRTTPRSDAQRLMGVLHCTKSSRIRRVESWSGKLFLGFDSRGYLP